MSINARKIKQFREVVFSYYKKHGRHDLPWRKTADPYRIAVSELMLQQTQVSRVKEKYEQFIHAFPTVESLAKAEQKEVLALWSGLGYNRRAKFLHALAREIYTRHNGTFPRDIKTLCALPGIGPYTGAAIGAFAFNIPNTCIETNIRTVYIHHFFPHAETVSDHELMPVIEETLDTEHPRIWYWALMDYGSHLKSIGVRVNRKSVQYVKQSTFRGSRRQVRGNILKFLLIKPMRIKELQASLEIDAATILSVCDDLVREGFIKKNRSLYFLV